MKANKYLFNVSSPVETPEEPAKGGAKKDPKKGAAQPTAPEVDLGIDTGNTVKIAIDNANPDEAERVLSFSVTVVFQGEPYEDPNPPEVDAVDAKKKAKGKEDAEPEVRMITPEAVTMEQENGRQFQIELGKYQMVPVSEEALANDASQKSISEANPTDRKSKMAGSSAVGDAAEEGDPSMEKKWFPYKLDHQAAEGEPMMIRKSTQGGVLTLEGLSFVLDPESFPMGVYEIVITDVTEGVEPEWHLEPLRVDLKIFDSTPIQAPI